MYTNVLNLYLISRLSTKIIYDIRFFHTYFFHKLSQKYRIEGIEHHTVKLLIVGDATCSKNVFILFDKVSDECSNQAWTKVDFLVTKTDQTIF